MAEESREQVEVIINNEEPISEEIDEEMNEEIKEEILKPKSKATSKAKAKPKIKITKEPVQPIEEEPIIDEQPKTIDKLKQIVKCPDCNMDMTQHTLKYIHERRGFCKTEKAEPEPNTPAQKPTTNLTNDIVNHYIQEHPEIVSTFLINARSMKAQRKHMHVRSLLNNAF